MSGLKLYNLKNIRIKIQQLQIEFQVHTPFSILVSLQHFH